MLFLLGQDSSLSPNPGDLEDRPSALESRYDAGRPVYHRGLNGYATSRRQTETTIGQFADQSLKGMVTSLVAKSTAFNLANYFHQLLGEPLLQAKEFAC